MQAVAMWLDHPAVGCGERCFLVAKVGRKWVRLLYPATLATVALDRTAFERARKQAVDAERLLRIARRTRKQYRRLGLRVSAKARAAI